MPTTKKIVYLLLFLSAALQAQLPYTKYWIAFTDKAATPYTITQPYAFLSAKTLERRAAYNIPVLENDLPVDPAYVQLVKDAGATVLYTSRWMNGAVITVPDSATLLAVQALPFVVNSRGVSKSKPGAAPGTRPKFDASVPAAKTQSSNVYGSDEYYGDAYHQISMLHGDYLHTQGYKGQGMVIAIMDAGFANVNNMTVFQSHFENGRILGTRDFVAGGSDVFVSSTHGTHVFAISGGNLPGTYVGAAPEASFWLFRTEDAPTETIIEEYNWLAAAEFADSVGVDVINTSLGYSEFDDTTMNYTYTDMNGNTAIISRAADLAASKGMLVVCSAGNQGNKAWQYITAPADADSVMTIGAVDSLGIYAFFSSKGPSSDGQIKPNVAAQGFKTAYVNIFNTVEKGNGTSYSAPIITGLAACLWQANRGKTNMEILQAIQQSASQFATPDSLLGYGLPNFYTAVLTVSNNPILQMPAELSPMVYPNPFNHETNIFYYATGNEMVNFELYDLSGKLIASYRFEARQNLPYSIRLSEWANVAKGTYMLHIKDQKGSKTLKVIKATNNP
ncbi:MAG TPA: S8 family serine peptidase [Chitinophagales bacterium]|nr:S8 family serine peptidase [Chitinophagales bacterium]HRK26713.1 S8 family serine peptidase [Chitinophagales bacterium]